MKLLRHKGTAALGLALALLLAGCSLAQPEAAPKEGTEDKFVGFHLVYEKMPPSVEEYEANPEAYPPEDRTHWVEYGSEDIKVDGIGKVPFPKEILIGQFNEDREGQDYVFPGLDGLNCFLSEEKMEGGGIRYAGHSGLSNVSIKVGGEEEALSGTVYIGLPLGQTEWDYSGNTPEYGWTAYRVFQMPDGTIYLDGTGNSYSGQGGMSFSTKEERTRAANGETTAYSYEVSVEMKEVPRLASVAVTQFASDNKAVKETSFALAELEGAAELTLEKDTHWLTVEEHAIDGTVKRTVYNREEIREDGLSHFLVLLDDRGMGIPTGLMIKP